MFDVAAAARPSSFSESLAWSGMAAARLASDQRNRILELVEALDVPSCTCAGLHVAWPSYIAGLLRRSLGDLDGAIICFRSGVESMSSMGALGYEAMAQAQLSRCLRERGGGRDSPEAETLAGVARATAARLGTLEVVNILDDTELRGA